MLDWLLYQWSKRPLVVYAAALVAAIALDAIGAVWGERRPVGGFFEEFVARTLHWGVAFGSVAAGIWTGMTASERTKSSLIGWIAGILVCIVIGVGTSFVTSKIPGVGWRVDRLMSDMD